MIRFEKVNNALYESMGQTVYSVIAEFAGTHTVIARINKSKRGYSYKFELGETVFFQPRLNDCKKAIRQQAYEHLHSLGLESRKGREVQWSHG